MMTSLRKSLGDVNTAAQAAAASLVGATGTVEQVTRCYLPFMDSPKAPLKLTNDS